MTLMDSSGDSPISSAAEGIRPWMTASAPSHDGREQHFADRFGAFLVDQRLAEHAAIERALRAAQTTGERLDRVLTKLGLVSEAGIAAALSKFLSIPIVTAAHIPSEPILPDVVDVGFVRRNRVMPLAIDDERLVVGVVDPLHEEPIRALAYLDQ